MADAGNRAHLGWLRQVAYDAGLTPFATRVAVGITRYFNRGTGDAYMAQETLAGDLSASAEGVRKALAQLEERGHLSVRRSSGRVSNRYRPVLQPPTAGGDKRASTPNGQRGLSDPQPPTARGSTPNGQRIEPPTAVGPNPLEENPLEEPPDSHTAELPLELTPAPSRKRANGEGYANDFERWWNAYPKRVGRKAAVVAYVKARKAGVEADTLFAGALAYAGQRAGKDPQFTKHPTTWLNGGCWADEPPVDWTPEQKPGPRRTAVDWAMEGMEE